MERVQYITVSELNEILGTSTYTQADIIKINEASETIKYFTRGKEYDVSDAPLNLKLATAYQVAFEEENDTYNYSATGFSIGKFSANKGNTNTEDFFNLSPKSRKYLIDGGLTRRVI